MQFKNILCVCTGNICRSPLAAAYLSRHLPEATVRSAGTHAVVDCPADERAAEVACQAGLDLSGHAGRQLTADTAQGQNLILVMEQCQLAWVIEQLPFVRGTTFIVSHWRDGQDVDDPYSGTRKQFDAVYSRLALCLDDWISRLRPARRA